MDNKGKVTVVLDGQAGSCGKGKLVGYLARKNGHHVAINNFMSNAGHTFVDELGNKVMTQHLPTSMVNKEMLLCVGPGAAITPSILFDEIINFADIIGDRKIMIHPRAMVIMDKHVEQEKALVRSGSTFKGCGTAQAEKLMRVPDTMLFGDYYKWMCETVHGEYDERADLLIDKIEIAETAHLVNSALDMGMNVMVEGSQGFDLDINYGLPYPHTTSRQCHAGQLVADCGISPRMVTDIIMIIRPYPIRISNQTNIGLEISSGDYSGSEEITWEIVKERCGAPTDVEFGEMTTVTKKPRRVFEMNWDRLQFATMVNRPTGVFINFAQYLDWGLTGMTTNEWHDMPIAEIKEKYPNVCNFIARVERETGCKVIGLGTGEKNHEVIMF